jgi:hypothetical protein
MLPDWTLSVEKYGRIQKGSVTLAPLVLMVGKNNTGKSYLASLIWAILCPRENLFPPKPPKGALYQACKSLIVSIRTGTKTVIAPADWDVIISWINGLLTDCRERLALNLVGHAAGAFGIATLTWDGGIASIKVSCDILPDGSKHRSPRNKSRPPVIGVRRMKEEIRVIILDNQIAERPEEVDFAIVKALAQMLLSGHNHTAIYVPAARTGLMLARKTLMAGLLRTMDIEGGEQRASVLPRPVVDFLLWLDSIEDDGNQSGYGIAKFIEDKILYGSISSGDDEEFIYSPNESILKLPLHASSSLVTELAPFVSLLKSGLLGVTLIFEEPEAHLHLGAQKVLARALVRLVNSGVQVIVTTHGDTLLQQINILMHLHEHPRRQELQAEFGYIDNELLDPKDARGYVYETIDNRTIIGEMKKVKAGFVDPVINNELLTLAKEALELDDE